MLQLHLEDTSTDTLLYELLLLTRRDQWRAQPLRFACEVFPQHFSRPPAAMHGRIMTAILGVAESSVVKEPPSEAQAERVGESGVPIVISLPSPPPVSTTEMEALPHSPTAPPKRIPPNHQMYLECVQTMNTADSTR